MARRQHERSLLDAVEQLVDGPLGVRRHDDGRAVPAVRDGRLDERLGQRLAVGGWPLVEPELDARVVGVERHGERTEQLLQSIEQLVGLLLELLRDDHLFPVPDVGQLGIGQRLGQLRPLVDRPRGDVVVHLDGLGVVRIPFGHADRRRYRCP